MTQVPAVIASRRLLVETILALDPWRDAVTVIGSHAVYEWSRHRLGLSIMGTTHDADTVVSPQLITPDPKIMDRLDAIGLVPSFDFMPGTYQRVSDGGIEWDERPTIDILAPKVYAGAGRRSARIEGQKNTVRQTEGLELCVWDRAPITLESFDSPSTQVDTFVAGVAALIVAKAHKVGDRYADKARPDRLRAKDSGDMVLLMSCESPEAVAATIQANSLAHPEIRPAIDKGAAYLIDLYTNPLSLPYRQALDQMAEYPGSWSPQFLLEWVSRFRDAMADEGTPAPTSTPVQAVDVPAWQPAKGL